MKRITLTSGCLMGALLLSGCQPTTDVAIVTPKSAIAGAKMIDEAEGDVKEQVQAPEACETEFGTDDGTILISVDATVDVPEADGIRLKKVETRVFNQTDMDNLQETLLGGNTPEQRIYTDEQEANGILWTKDEINAILEKLENYAAESDGFLYNNVWAIWNEQLDTAPDSFPVAEVSTQVVYDEEAAKNYWSTADCEDVPNTIWGGVSMDGRIYNFFLNNNWYSDFKNVTACLVCGYSYPSYAEPDNIYRADEDYFYEEYNTMNVAVEAYDSSWDIEETEKETQAESESADDSDRVLEIPMEELESEAETIADALGIENMKFAAYEKCSRSDEDLGVTLSAVNLIYTPVLDGIPVTYTSSRYLSDDEIINYSESFEAAYDNDGLVQIIWQNPSTIYDMSDEYVFLLPFSDILETFRKETPELHRTEDGIQKVINITDIKLGYMWVPDESTEMEGMLIPVWDFMGTISYHYSDDGSDIEYLNTDPYQSILTINAMDGTVAEGYCRPY